MDEFSLPDPYLSISLISKSDGAVFARRCTITSEDTLNPQWNETYAIEIPDGADFQASHEGAWTLQLAAYDEDWGSADTLIGTCSLGPEEIDFKLEMEGFRIAEHCKSHTLMKGNHVQSTVVFSAVHMPMGEFAEWCKSTRQVGDSYLANGVKEAAVHTDHVRRNARYQEMIKNEQAATKQFEEKMERASVDTGCRKGAREDVSLLHGCLTKKRRGGNETKLR
jgi:hypothetical protein